MQFVHILASSARIKYHESCNLQFVLHWYLSKECIRVNMSVWLPPVAGTSAGIKYHVIEYMSIYCLWLQFGVSCN